MLVFIVVSVSIQIYVMDFVHKWFYNANDDSQSVVVANVNGDNKRDIIVANYGSFNIDVLINCF